MSSQLTKNRLVLLTVPQQAPCDSRLLSYVLAFDHLSYSPPSMQHPLMPLTSMLLRLWQACGAITHATKKERIEGFPGILSHPPLFSNSIPPVG